MKTLEQISLDTQIKSKLHKDWKDLCELQPTKDWDTYNKFILGYIEGLNEIREAYTIEYEQLQQRKNTTKEETALLELFEKPQSCDLATGGLNLREIAEFIEAIVGTSVSLRNLSHALAKNGFEKRKATGKYSVWEYLVIRKQL